MNSAENFTLKQWIFLSIAIVSLLIGVLFLMTTPDLLGKVIGGVLVVAGIVFSILAKLVRHAEIAGRLLLKQNGRRVNSYVSVVHRDGGFQGSSFYRLELKDPDDDAVTFMSDSLNGDGSLVEHMLEYYQQQGPESRMVIPTYVDRTDPSVYFVDVNADFEKSLEINIRQMGG